MIKVKLIIVVCISSMLFCCTDQDRSIEKANIDSITVVYDLQEESDFEKTNERNNTSYNEEKINTTFCYPIFDIRFYNYSFQETRKNENESASQYPYSNDDTLNITFIERDGVFYMYPKFDTLKLVEEVFNDLDTTLVQIIPKNKFATFKISISIKQIIHEQFDNREFITDENMYSKEYNEAYLNWEPTAVRWEGWTPYKEIKDSLSYYFRMPLLTTYDYIPEIKKELDLRDTLVSMKNLGDYGGDDIANLVYKNKPCYFDIDKGILKIECFVDGKMVDRKFISIWFSSGC
jgi:hypothetical protein